MDWDKFVPTREIREYDTKFRESVRQREQLKVELAGLEKRKRDIFWDVEYPMFLAGLKYFNTSSEYWLYKLESEYIRRRKSIWRNRLIFRCNTPRFECCVKKISYICVVFWRNLEDNTY